MSDDLLIKISADTKDIKNAYEDVAAKTEDLQGALDKIAKVSGIAFAALGAQVGFALHAFEEADASSRQLTQALQNQGIYTDKLKESYKEYAEAVQKATGFEADEVTKAQAIAQSYLGQIPVTQKLTSAIADLAQAQGISLAQAAEEMGKAIGNGTGALLREGVQFSSTSTEAERYAKTLEFVQTKYGGQAEAANQGLGSIRGLQAAFKDTQQELGQRFAPVMVAVIKALTDLLTPAKDSSGVMTDLKAALIAVAFVMTGLLTALPLLSSAFLTVRAAMIALNAQLTLTQALLAGLGIGLLSIAITELALHWKQATAVITAVTKDMVEFVSKAFSGLKEVLDGAFHLDKAKITAGLNEIGEAFKKIGTDAKEGWNNANAATKEGVTKQDEMKKEAAEKDAARRKEQEAARINLQREEDEAILLELKNASDAEIEVKKAEIETLKALETSKNAEEKQLLRDRYAQLKAEEVVQHQESMEQEKGFEKEKLAAQSEHGNEKVRMQTMQDKKEEKAIQASYHTQEMAQKKVYQDDMKARVQAHNTFLEEEIKYGTAYATINQAMHSAVFQGSKQAFGELAQLQQSSNSTLKQIGKIAAIANIVIKTAESAMNIYAGFSTIPIIGPVLGIAGAAAAVAFGVEQVGKVNAAATGGMVQGVGYGDKVPYLLEPGEIVTPRQNFNELIAGIAQQRGYTTGDEQNGGEQSVKVVIGFDGRDAQQVLTARRVEDRALGTYRSNV